MILFHGSNVKVSDIDLSKCRPNKDFGRGFYLTDIEEQAVQMSKRVTRMYGGTPTVSRFDLDEKIFSDDAVSAMIFEAPNREWALFVINNRNRKYADHKNPLSNHDNKYDIVTGAVANDDIAYLFRTFSNGLIDMDALVRGLEYKILTRQYSFHTTKALRYLKASGGR